MNLYCINCGHPNPYSINKPEHCSKCNLKFGLGSIKFTQPVSQAPVYSDISFEEENDAFYHEPFEFEPFTEEEIRTMNIAHANQGINMGNFIKSQQSMVDSPKKRRGRPPKK